MKTLIPVGLFLISFTVFSEAEDTIYLSASATEDLKSKEGQKIVVHGTVGDGGKSASRTNFVNFKDAEFFLVTFKSDLHQFPDGEPADLFKGKRIAVEGTISIHQDKPQIKLTRPGQVTILAPDAVFPPIQPTKPIAPPPVPAAKPEVPAAAPAPAAPKPKPPVDPSEYFKKKE